MFTTATSANNNMANFETLVVLDPVTNSKGQKNCAIMTSDSQNAFWTLQSPVTPIWQPSAFKGISGESTGKLSLCVNADPGVMAEAASLDAWAVDYATTESMRLFGRSLTRDQVVDRYNGALKISTDKPSYLKFKLGVDRNAPNYWTNAKEKRETPEDFPRCLLQCRLRILGVWFMGNSFGITLQLADAQVISEQACASCPF